MNYFPYYNAFPYAAASSLAKPGLFSSITGGLKFSSILSGAQKALNIANQAIPLIKQAGPVINNAKTMFRVMNEFKKVDTPNKEVNTTVNNVSTNSTETNIQENKQVTGNTGLTFFQ